MHLNAYIGTYISKKKQHEYQKTKPCIRIRKIYNKARKMYKILFKDIENMI